MRLGLRNIDPSTSINLDVSAASIEPKIVSVTIDKVLTLDFTSFKVEVMLSLQSHDDAFQIVSRQSDKVQPLHDREKKLGFIINMLFYQLYFCSQKTRREIIDCLSPRSRM